MIRIIRLGPTQLGAVFVLDGRLARCDIFEGDVVIAVAKVQVEVALLEEVVGFVVGIGGAWNL